MAEVYSDHLESPGTKAYTLRQAREMFSAFSDIQIEIELTHGDLLSAEAGQRHQGPLLNIARKIWPRFFIKAFLKSFGLFMLIQATKKNNPQ